MTALKTPFRDGNLQDLAKDVLKITTRGLVNRARIDGSGQDESIFLKPLQLITETGITPAEEMLMRFDRDWKQKIDRVFTEYAY